nr:dCTP pyrophosphatase 1-like [Ipomoea batatas]
MTGEEGSVSLDLLKKKMNDFAKETDWEKFHSPRNLLLAMRNLQSLSDKFRWSLDYHVKSDQVGEVGELSEIFQWKGEVPKGLPGWEETEKTHLGEELSDVLLYLVRLSDVCGIDLGKAALRKVELNALKYPANNTNSPCKSKNSKESVKMSN